MAAGAASWSFTEDDYGAITETLQRFLGESNARCALLVDRAGQLVATLGEQPNFDPTAFATLTAADFSANDQLARLIGETDFKSLFHQGEKESMYLADVARRVILVTQSSSHMARRAVSAWAIVTPSAYSRSPPMGMPRAIRVTAIDVPANCR